MRSSPAFYAIYLLKSTSLMTLAVHLAKREVRVKWDESWQKVRLGRYEFDLLEILITNAGRPIRKTALQVTLKPGDDEYMSASFLHKLVSTLQTRSNRIRNAQIHF